MFQIIIGEAGRRTRAGQIQTTSANELYPIVEHNILDELDRWLSVPEAPASR